MTTGSVADIQARLLSNIPPWFPSSSPALLAILNGSATALAFIYSAYQYAISQTRLLKMSGLWLDLFSFDFFGFNLLRRPNEADGVFLGRIRKELFRQRVTRAGMVQAMTDLTGSAPTVIELWNPGDCGGYDAAPGLGYDVAGVWGSYDYPYQYLMQTPLPAGAGIPNIAGYDNPQGGYDVGGAAEYADPAAFAGQVTPAQIYSVINENRAAGVTVWVQIGASAAVKITYASLVSGLPTSDPGVAGALYDNGGVICISQYWNTNIQLPTSDPGIQWALWNDGGVLSISSPTSSPAPGVTTIPLVPPGPLGGFWCNNGVVSFVPGGMWIA